MDLKKLELSKRFMSAIESFKIVSKRICTDLKASYRLVFKLYINS